MEIRGNKLKCIISLNLKEILRCHFLMNGIAFNKNIKNLEKLVEICLLEI